MEELLRQLERASIKIRGRVSGYSEGKYRSMRLGNSYDFYGTRPYCINDDIKNVDWKGYARSEKLNTKLFNEQKGINVTIFVDNSSSMDFGSPAKWEKARLYSLGISYIALKEFNRLNIYSFSDKVELNMNNLSGKNLIHYIESEFNKIKPEGKTDFNSCFSSIEGKKGLLFIITDLIGDKTTAFLDNIPQRYEKAVLIHVISNSELNPEFRGNIKFIDKETGRFIVKEVGEKEIEKYKKNMNLFIENCCRQCEKRGIRYIFADENKSPVEVILKAAEVE